MGRHSPAISRQKIRLAHVGIEVPARTAGQIFRICILLITIIVRIIVRRVIPWQDVAVIVDWQSILGRPRQLLLTLVEYRLHIVSGQIGFGVIDGHARILELKYLKPGLVISDVNDDDAQKVPMQRRPVLRRAALRVSHQPARRVAEVNGIQF